MSSGRIESFVGMLDPDWVIAVVTAFMVVLAVIDLATFLDRPLPWRREAVQHRDLKTAIVSLGILGTFIGITIGLVQFDTSDVHGSIPNLLSGLEVAFFTSVVGMALSILLAVIQRLVNANAGRDNTEQLDRIANLIERGNEANQEGFANMRTGLITLQNGLTSIGGRISVLSTDVGRTRSEVLQRLDTVNNTLERALEKIAQDASREIVEMLRRVVREFDIIIQRELGKSLRQLSKACEDLLKWQEQHKGEIEAVHAQLLSSIEVSKHATEVLDSSAKKVKAVQETLDRIADVISTLDKQAQTTTDHLKHYAEVATEVKKMLEGVMAKINDAGNRIVNLATVSQEKFNKQVELQGKVLTSMEKTEKEIGEIGLKVKAHTEETQKKLSSQAEQIGKMTKETIENFWKGLRNMEKIFIKVTGYLGDAYGKRLKDMDELVKELNATLRELQKTLHEMRGRSNE